MGDYNSEETYVLELSIYQCYNTTENNNHCKTTAEIEDLYGQGFVNILTKSGYLDYDDYTTPIKEYVNDDNTLDLVNYATNSIIINVQENHALLSDNRIYQSEFEKKPYYSISGTNKNAYNKTVYPGSYGFITFKLDKVTEEYERIVYSLLDMFGYIGGLYDFLSLIGFLFVSGFQNKLYYNEIFSKLYQVEKVDTKDDNKSKIDDILFGAQMNKTIQNTSVNILRNEELKHDLNVENKSSEVQDFCQESETNSISSVSKIHDASSKIKLRRAYNYKCYQLFPYSSLLRYCQRSK